MKLRQILGIKKTKKLRKKKYAEKNEASQGLARRIQNLIDPSFDIDVVITWVDGADASHREKRQKYSDPHAPREAVADHRLKSHDELRYCLRSIDEFAPWVRKVFLVTDDQRPAWLLESERLEVVSHRDILDAAVLPTFNSHVIESAIHLVPGLSNHFIYFNDDVLLMRECRAGEFFSAGGCAINFSSRTLVPENPVHGIDTASSVAAGNALRLIERRYGVSSKRRFSHSPIALRKDVILDCEREFAPQFGDMRRNRFRQGNDIFCANFLYPYCAYLDGKGIIVDSSLWYIKVRRPEARDFYRKAFWKKGESDQRLACCINDTGSSEDDSTYEEDLVRFLDDYFPRKSSFER